MQVWDSLLSLLCTFFSLALGEEMRIPQWLGQKKLGKTLGHPQRFKIVSTPYQNHIKTTNTLEKSTKSLSLGCFCFLFWSQPTRTITKSNQNYQNCINTVSTPYQNHIKTTKTLGKSTKSLSLGCFCFLSWSQRIGNPESLKKALRSQTISKPYLNHNPNHITNISKPYWNHKK